MRKLLTLILLFTWTCPSMADEHPYKVSDDLDKTILAGLHELYNFNFDKSLEIFDTIKDQEKDHPMVAFGVASTQWWKVTTAVMDADSEASKPFLTAVNHCIDVSQALVKRGDPTGEGHLTLGGALGLYGRWQATNREWSGAYFKGKKAYKYLVEALEINPKLVDANMGKGIFDYYVATLPALVRVLAFIGMGGDKTVGLRELKEAADHGTYARTSSALFLADIYSNLEGTPDKSYPIPAQLREEYPNSFFIHMVNLIALYNEGDVETLKKEAQLYQQKVQDGIYAAQAATSGEFAMGMAYFKIREWAEAEKHFRAASLSTDSTDPWRIWGMLHYGYVCDVQGRRDEAVLAYKFVLKQTRRWGSHDNAKARLKEPFKGTDEDLKKLRL